MKAGPKAPTPEQDVQNLDRPFWIVVDPKGAMQLHTLTDQVANAWEKIEPDQNKWKEMVKQGWRVKQIQIISPVLSPEELRTLISLLDRMAQESGNNWKGGDKEWRSIQDKLNPLIAAPGRKINA